MSRLVPTEVSELKPGDRVHLALGGEAVLVAAVFRTMHTNSPCILVRTVNKDHIEDNYLDAAHTALRVVANGG